jgi:putative FmdB family regulatory protein
VPLYEYRCLDCAHQYEKREGFDASALQKCPTCGGTARRVLHAAPIVFKGSGFYVTDNRKSAPEAESEAKVEPAKTGEDSAGKDAEPPPGADSPTAKAAAS